MRTTEVEAALGEKIYKVAQVAGGDINQAFKVELVSGKIVFVKWQDRELPGMFEAEAAGLDWLRPGPIRIPSVLAHGDHWIALEWLEHHAVAVEAVRPRARATAPARRAELRPRSAELSRDAAAGQHAGA